MNFNKNWTREKLLEYRKLKRDGYTQKMLIEHFGEDIYHSGIYNKKSTIMPYLDFITEINITPEYTEYNLSEIKSDIYPNKFDYIIEFENKGIYYIISLFYYIIEDIQTYNIIFTTKKQWDNYKLKINQFRNKGYITNKEREDLVNTIETGYNHLYDIMKKISYIISDVINNKMGNIILSIGETKNIVKINLYRNIIINSFPTLIETGTKYDENGNKYFLYQIN